MDDRLSSGMHLRNVAVAMHTRKSLASDLHALGLAAGDVVMVHASVRSIGEVAGGPDEIHLAIKDVLTPEGTLIMYASCPQYVDEVGRGNLTAEQEAEVLQKLPAFDPANARSDRSNGALVELLRTYPGTRVNSHVARFAVWGRLAEHLLSQQPWDYAFGAGSALDRFTSQGGRILLLGSDHDNVTYLHYAEHIADIPDKRVVRFKVPVTEMVTESGGRWPSSTLPEGRMLTGRATFSPGSSTLISPRRGIAADSSATR